jgi:eukaryotic-like serine/threonine-protein kinase
MAELPAREPGVLDDGTAVSLNSPREYLGRGGFGEVTAGTRIVAGERQPVACKSLVAGSGDREVQAFQRECEIAVDASQRCTRVARAYGRTTIHGKEYLVMMRYHHGDFSKVLERPLSVPAAIHFGWQLCEGLEQLHGCGIVVRDLKPSNILVDVRGHLVLSDFGIAKVGDTDTTTTATGAQKGSAHYMAPEQFDPDVYGQIAAQTDVWAWACIMVQMLTGQLPWGAAAAADDDHDEYHIEAPYASDCGV